MVVVSVTLLAAWVATSTASNPSQQWQPSVRRGPLACLPLPKDGLVLARANEVVVVCPGVHDVNVTRADGGGGAAAIYVTASNVTVLLLGVSITPLKTANGSNSYDGWGVRAQGCSGLTGEHAGAFH
jgi:hypothetical protein